MNYKQMAEEDGIPLMNSAGLSPLLYKFPVSKWEEIPAPLNRPSYLSDQPTGQMILTSSFQFYSSMADGGTIVDRMDQLRRKRKRRRLPPPRGRLSKRIAAIESLEPVMLFAKPVDPAKLAAVGIVPPLVDIPVSNCATRVPYQFHGRFGRGGRIVLDRWNPLMQTPLSSTPAFPLQ
ncbi:hypothetical protein O6H91_Y470600 [Diphasiastrum complanatum]|nr:hypothetical protein O6H91_Y470600 [Diphasiastrum complanatum]